MRPMPMRKVGSDTPTSETPMMVRDTSDCRRMAV